MWRPARPKVLHLEDAVLHMVSRYYKQDFSLALVSCRLATAGSGRNRPRQRAGRQEQGKRQRLAADLAQQLVAWRSLCEIATDSGEYDEHVAQLGAARAAADASCWTTEPDERGWLTSSEHVCKKCFSTLLREWLHDGVCYSLMFHEFHEADEAC